MFRGARRQGPEIVAGRFFGKTARCLCPWVLYQSYPVVTLIRRFSILCLPDSPTPSARGPPRSYLGLPIGLCFSLKSLLSLGVYGAIGRISRNFSSKGFQVVCHRFVIDRIVSWVLGGEII
jgi:hypothetical protein